MADDKPSAPEVAVAADEEPKTEGKSASAKKKSREAVELDSSKVLTGPRQRKKAEHFQVEVKEKAEFVIKPGKGAKLGDIPNVHFLLGKLKPDDELVTSLHALLFKRQATVHRRKRNLFEFSGLAFDDDEKEKELEKIQERLGKWTIPLLNGALDVFELPRGNGDEGKKEAKVKRLLKFLEEPQRQSDKDLAAQAAKKKDAAKAKKEKEQKSKTPKSAAKGGRKSEAGQESAKKKRGKKAESEEAAEEASEDDRAEESDAEEEEQEAEPETVQPKKRVKREESASAKATPATGQKTTGKKRKANEDEAAEGPSGEGADEAGSGAAASDLPDDEAIKEATLALVTVADVNTTTVKHLLTKLNKKFGTDLSTKKKLIKKIAVDYAQWKTSEEAGEAQAGEPKESEPAEDGAPPPAKKQKTDEKGDAAKSETTSRDEEDAVMADAKPDSEPKAPEAAGGPADGQADVNPNEPTGTATKGPVDNESDAKRQEEKDVAVKEPEAGAAAVPAINGDAVDVKEKPSEGGPAAEDGETAGTATEEGTAAGAEAKEGTAAEEEKVVEAGDKEAKAVDS